MADNTPNDTKPKLRKVDTNRLKVERSGERASDAPDVNVPPGAADPGSTVEIRDPMSLRDTSVGKLKRIQSPDETASAVSPIVPDEDGEKSETVRLKVVRDASGTPIPGARLSPKKSTSSLRISSQKSGETPASDETTTVTPPAAGDGDTATVKVQLTPPGLRDTRNRVTSTVRVTPPGTPEVDEAAAKKAVTSTLKIRPGAPAPDGAGEGDGPPEPKTVTSTLRVRPPAASAGSTVKIKPPSPAGQPAASAESTGEGQRATLKLKKAAGTEPPPVVLPGVGNEAMPIIEEPAPAESTAGSTVAITPPEVVPPAEGARKGLKLKGKAGASEEAQGGETAATATEDEAVSLQEPIAHVAGPESSRMLGVMTLVAAVALAVLSVRLVLDFLQYR